MWCNYEKKEFGVCIVFVFKFEFDVIFRLNFVHVFSLFFVSSRFTPAASDLNGRETSNQKTKQKHEFKSYTQYTHYEYKWEKKMNIFSSENWKMKRKII